jgi:hypothetical protein
MLVFFKALLHHAGQTDVTTAAAINQLPQDPVGIAAFFVINQRGHRKMLKSADDGSLN